MEFEKVIPQYVQIAETLSRRIVDYRYSTNQLPPSWELEKDFGVSEITIRKALHILVQKGEITRKRGLGTLINQREKHRKFDYFGNFRELIDSDSSLPVKTKTNVLEITVTRSFPDEIRQQLQLSPDASVWRLKRLRSHNGQAVSYFINYGLVGLFDCLKPQDLRNSTFINAAAQCCGIEFSEMEQWVEVEVADSDLAALMSIQFGTPMFFAKNIYFLGSNRPVALTQMYFRGDKYKFFNKESLATRR
jgi:GntR family transcriptional regulator